MSCIYTTKTDTTQGCGCGHHHDDDMRMPFNININNSPVGSYEAMMAPVVNTPPVVINSQPSAPQYVPMPMPSPGHTVIVEEPEIHEHSTEIVRREPRIYRSAPTQVVTDEPPVYVASTQPREPFQFRKHYVPTWY